MNTTLFSGKVALVTGGAYGIGSATAIAFAKNGAKVVVADIAEDDTTVRTITEHGGEAVFISCDVSKEDDVKRMIDTAIAQYGSLDLAVNNAGIEGDPAPAHECSSENWNAVIATNLTGIWHCMKYEIAQMLKQGKGAIVNTASIAGLVGLRGVPAYVASKHGIVGLTKSAALDYAREGIRVNAVCPGLIETPMIDRITDNEAKMKRRLVDMEPMGRIGQPEEVAATIIWLCSDAASFVTGHTMTVDGGWVAK